MRLSTSAIAAGGARPVGAGRRGGREAAGAATATGARLNAGTQRGIQDRQFDNPESIPISGSLHLELSQCLRSSNKFVETSEFLRE